MPLDTKRIEARRRELGLSQEEAARRAGFGGRAYWNDIVHGRKSNVTLQVLEDIARALDCDARDLIQSGE